MKYLILTTLLLAHTLANATITGMNAATLTSGNAVLLQGKQVSSTVPTSAQILTYNSTTGQWEPAAAASSGASVTLNNLVSPLINTNLTFNTGADAIIKTSDAASGTTKGISYQSGNASGGNTNTGAVFLNSGSPLGSGYSGAVLVGPAAADSGNGGELDLSGGPSNTGAGGQILIEAGYVNGGTGAGGNLQANAGNSTGGAGGTAIYTGGDSATGNGGPVNISGGNTSAGTGSGGTITLTPGTSFGGAAGVIKFAGSSATVAYPWIATNTDGSGHYAQLDLTGVGVVNALPATKGGTGLASGTSGGIPYFSDTTHIASSALLAANQVVLGGGAGATPATLAAGSQYQSLVMGASNPAYGAVNLAQSAAITGALPVTNGGTGLATLTNHALQVGAATSTPTQLGLGTSTQVLHGAAAGDPTWGQVVNADITNSTIDLTAKVTGVLPAVNGGSTASQLLSNCSIATSVGSSALTLALKDAAGSDPSATSPCIAAFRNATATTGTYTLVSATAATSLVIRSTDTLGCISAIDCYLYVYLINNAGTIELAAIMGSMLDEGITRTTVAELAAGTESVLYSTTARTSVAIRALARIQIQEATAGTWASNATTISNWPFKKLKWMVHATIAGANPAISLTSNGAYLDFTAAMTLTNVAGLNKIPAWITCSTTNAPTGTTCGAGTPDVGISWILPEAGNVVICMAGLNQMNTTAGTDLENYFEIVETATNAQTILQSGGVAADRLTQAVNANYIFNISTCTTMNFSTAGRKAVRLFDQVFAAGTNTLNQWYTTQSPTEWTAYPVD